MMYILVGLCAISILLNIVLVSYNHRVVHWANYWKKEALRQSVEIRNAYRALFETKEEADDRRAVQQACIPEG